MIKIITNYGQLLVVAMGYTMLLSAFGLFFACIIGIIVGMMSIVKNRVCNFIARVFVDVIRGVPMIVLAYFIFFGVPYAMKNLLGVPMTLTALQAGTACLALNCGAYMAEIIRGGILSVDVGQMEAARSLGLPYWRAMYRVVLPQAIRNMIPSIINQFIVTLKDTSLLSVIGLRELTQNTKIIVANNMEALRMYFIVGVYYWVFVSVLTLFAHMVERRTKYGK